MSKGREVAGLLLFTKQERAQESGTGAGRSVAQRGTNCQMSHVGCAGIMWNGRKTPQDWT